MKLIIYKVIYHSNIECRLLDLWLIIARRVTGCWFNILLRN
jgi:hypothetical protein